MNMTTLHFAMRPFMWYHVQVNGLFTATLEVIFLKGTADPAIKCHVRLTTNPHWKSGWGLRAQPMFGWRPDHPSLLVIAS